MRICLAPNKVYKNLFLLLNCIGLIACFINIKIGVLSSILIVLICFEHFNSELFFSDTAFIIYLLSCLISGIAYLWNDRPITIFFAAISFNVFPSLLFYLGRYIAQKNETDIVIEKMLNAFVFMMLIGTVTYLLFPNFYFNYMGQSIDSYTYGLGEYRYGSFISSIALGSVGTISTILYFYTFDKLQIWQKALYLPLIILNVLMSMQRAAWIITGVAIISCVLLKFGRNKKTRYRLLGLLLFLLLVIAIFWYNRTAIFTTIQLTYFERRISVINLNDMSSSRVTQWSDAWNVFLNNPLTGYGLGSCGQKAAPYGLSIVTDGNHLRILAEIGIIGFLAFVYMNIRAICFSLHQKKYYFVLVILLCNLAAIGSPIFDQYYASFAYWLILGVATKKYRSR